MKTHPCPLGSVHSKTKNKGFLSLFFKGGHLGLSVLCYGSAGKGPEEAGRVDHSLPVPGCLGSGRGVSKSAVLQRWVFWRVVRAAGGCRAVSLRLREAPRRRNWRTGPGARRLRHGPAHYCPLQGLPWRPLNHPPCARWLYQQAFLPHRGCSQQVSQGWPFRRAAGLLWSNAQQPWRETRCSQPGPDPALDWLWSPPLKACGKASGSFWLFPSAPDGDHKCWEAATETGTRSPLSGSENRYRGYRNKRELTSVNIAVGTNLKSS